MSAVDSKFLERHYTTSELADAWNTSPVSVYRKFCDIPGVLKLGDSSGRRRTRRELRIPQSIAQMVYEKDTK